MNDPKRKFLFSNKEVIFTSQGFYFYCFGVLTVMQNFEYHFYLGMHVGRGNGNRSEFAVLLCLTLRGQLGRRKRSSWRTERKTEKEKEEAKWISVEVKIYVHWNLVITNSDITSKNFSPKWSFTIQIYPVMYNGTNLVGPRQLFKTEFYCS